MPNTTLPRGIRNNNAGNIDYNPKTQWQGLDPAEPSDGRFCRFTKPEYGIRAIARVLQNYTKRDGTAGVGLKGIDTVYEIINRWAPPVENDTAAYIKSVADKIGKDAKEHIELTDANLCILVKAIVKHENGIQPYSDETVLAGVQLA